MSVKPPTRFLLMLLGISFLGAPLAAQHVPRLDSYDGVVVRILQSNNAGDIQHIIDPLTNEVVGVIEGCPRPHNLFAHPKGRYYYCTNETESTLDVFDTKTLRLVEQLPLTARPNKGAINKKHRKIYVGISAAPFVDVFNLDTHEKITSVSVTTGIHNVYVSPDGNWVVAGLTARSEGSIQIIDPNTDEVVGLITLVDDRGEPHTVRPMAFLAGDDGSTNKIFDVHARQPVHVCRDLGIRPHHRRRPADSRDRREDEDGRTARQDRRGDPPAGSCEHSVGSLVREDGC